MSNEQWRRCHDVNVYGTFLCLKYEIRHMLEAGHGGAIVNGRIIVIKVFVLIKRREGTSMEEFIDYYEKKNAELAIKSVPNLKKYVRHYLHPFVNEVYSMDKTP